MKLTYVLSRRVKVSAKRFVLYIFYFYIFILIYIYIYIHIYSHGRTDQRSSRTSLH